MASELRPNRINIDLQAYKQPWLDYCKARDVTPSEAFRQIVAKLTAGSGEQSATPAEIAGAGDVKIRKEVRLTRSELHQVESLAAREGFSLNRWIVALINARLAGSAQLGQQELEGLARSNLQMLAIGRNLNQLAKVANQTGTLSAHLHAGLIKRVHGAVMQHAGQVARVMDANIQRWRQ